MNESPPRPIDVHIAAAAELPTRFGTFRIHVFTGDRVEHVAMVHGEVWGVEEVPVHVHSQCIDGDTFGSCQCDCAHRLHRALETIGKAACGVAVYLQKESVLALRNPDRERAVAASMLQTLGIRSAREIA